MITQFHLTHVCMLNKLIGRLFSSLFRLNFWCFEKAKLELAPYFLFQSIKFCGVKELNNNTIIIINSSSGFSSSTAAPLILAMTIYFLSKFGCMEQGGVTMLRAVAKAIQHTYQHPNWAYTAYNVYCTHTHARALSYIRKKTHRTHD